MAHRWLRIGSLCKSLRVLPRAGGVLDQPAEEILMLEQILNAFAKYEEYLDKKRKTRTKNRARHAPQSQEVRYT